MIVKKVGKFKIIKDGTSYYRVMEGRKRIGSFLQLSDAEKYLEKRKEIVETKKIEQLWLELEDITFIEDIDNYNELILSSDWLHFGEGTPREHIWKWFDEVHPKGVSFLMYEMEIEIV